MSCTARADARRPCAARQRASRAIGAVVLAAGQSRRMGGRNKLLVDIGGVPMVRRVVDCALACRLDPVVVVTGYQREALEAALEGAAVRFIHNPCYRDGMGTTLAAGARAMPRACHGVFICLADMPWVTPRHFEQLMAAFAGSDEPPICVPTCGGVRGHPVLFSSRFFASLTLCRGDSGARTLLEREAARVREVVMPDDAVLRDVDSPRALADLRAG